MQSVNVIAMGGFPKPRGHATEDTKSCPLLCCTLYYSFAIAKDASVNPLSMH